MCTEGLETAQTTSWGSLLSGCPGAVFKGPPWERAGSAGGRARGVGPGLRREGGKTSGAIVLTKRRAQRSG